MKAQSSLFHTKTEYVLDNKNGIPYKKGRMEKTYTHINKGKVYEV